MPPDDTTRLPDWRDDTIYQWTFRHTRKQFSRVLGYLIVACALFPAVLCGFFWCIGLLWPSAAFWLSVAVALFFLFLTVYTLGKLCFGRRERPYEVAGKTAPVTIVALSALAYVLAAPDQLVRNDFRNTDGAGVGQWVLFWLDNALSVVLLGIPQVFQVQFSPIVPDGTVSRLATVVLRLLVGAAVVEGVLRCYRATFHDERFHGTMAECYWKCEGLSGAEQVEVVLEGRVQRLPERRAVNAARIIETFKEQARQTG